MQGIIGFEDLLIRCIIGINPDERLVEQEILLNLQYKVDVSLVAKTDDLSQAINYSSVAEFCIQFAKKNQYKMLETLAVELTQKLAEQFKLSWIKILIKKPSALPYASFAYVEFEYDTKAVS